MAQRKRRSNGALNWLPLAYFAVALLLAVLALPSALRPPQQPPSQTAELSPDAPPDDEQQSIISSLSRASSGTAGTGTGVGEGEPADVAIAPAAATRPAALRSCPFGFGNPPRQTFSHFSAACAPSWSGDNGGATWKGVTATEVRVGISDHNGDKGTEGPVPDVPRPNESSADRTLRIWQKWFNTHYQFWGRRLQLVMINGHDGSDGNKMRALAAEADEVHKIFAGAIGRWQSMDELARRKIISFAEQGDYFSGSWLAARRPYAWSIRPDSSRMMRMTAEFACKSLVGRPARFAGDPALQSEERVIGILYYDNEAYRSNEPEFRSALEANCGGRVALAVGFTGDGASSLDANATATAGARLRSEGVTTVVAAMNTVDIATATNSFTSQGYFPEWIVGGVGMLDTNFHPTLLDERQWRHAFGIGAAMVADGQAFAGVDMDPYIGYRAYKEIEPSSDPDGNFTMRQFAALEHIANGIQMAGPNLTPDTFAQGLFRMGRMTNDLPPWEMVGGFGPGDYSFPDEVGVIWWDPTARANHPSIVGAYRWLFGAERFGSGELPAGEHADLFQRGITRREEATG